MNRKIESTRVYTTAEAAKILSIHPITVNRLCSKGRLKAIKLREWKILGENILEFCGSTAVK